MKRLFFILFFCLVSQAYADQCAWLAADAASRFEQLIDDGKIKNKHFVEFCHLCDCDQISEPRMVRAVSKKQVEVDPDYFEFSFITEQGDVVSLDLAYTFIESESGSFKNIGALTACIEDLDYVDDLVVFIKVNEKLFAERLL